MRSAVQLGDLAPLDRHPVVRQRDLLFLATHQPQGDLEHLAAGRNGTAAGKMPLDLAPIAFTPEFTEQASTLAQ